MKNIKLVRWLKFFIRMEVIFIIIKIVLVLAFLLVFGRNLNVWHISIAIFIVSAISAFIYEKMRERRISLSRQLNEIFF